MWLVLATFHLTFAFYYAHALIARHWYLEVGGAGLVASALIALLCVREALKA